MGPQAAPNPGLLRSPLPPHPHVPDTPTEKRPLKEDLRSLLEAPRELWIVLFANVVASVGLYSLLFTVILWFSQYFSMSDVAAWWWVIGASSMSLTVFTFLSGFVADAIGFRRSLIIAFGVSMVARAGMVLAPGWVVAVASLILFALGAA